MSGKPTFIEAICKSIGENNNAAYAVVAVATAKGIFRPMFTMMDKHADYETKKYTAMREGLTEAIAIPCYLGVAAFASKVVAPMMYEGKKKARAAKVLSFLGVCAAALVIIPAACSALIKPIMTFIQEHKKHPNSHQNIAPNNTLDITDKEITSPAPAEAAAVLSAPAVQKVAQKSYQAFPNINYNSNLRIGGGS